MPPSDSYPSQNNSSQEFREKVDSKNNLNNLQNNRTSSEKVEQQTDYNNTGDDIIKPDYTTNANTQPPTTSSSATSLVETNTLDTMEEDEVFVKHPRQKSQEEMVYEQQAALLASQLKDKDKQLSEVIQPPPSRK